MIKIGIYDSGCGGFTVLNQIMKNLIDAEIVYYGDAVNNPWGNKSKETLEDILHDINLFFDQHNVTHIVTGCNTTVGLFKSSLSEIFKKPVYTLFDDSIKNYTNNGYSILSTKNSSEIRLFSTFLNQHNTIKTQEIACPTLAQLIETNQIDKAFQQLEIHLSECIYQHVILGCTHYPLVLSKQTYQNKQIINPATFLTLPFNTVKNKKYIVNFYTSGNKQLFQKQIHQYLHLNEFILNGELFSNIKQVSSSF